MSTKGAVIAAMAAGFFSTVIPMAVRAEDAKVHCSGVNECKGKGGCKSAGNACAGKNGCKGKGWMEMTAAECKEKGGKVAKAAK